MGLSKISIWRGEMDDAEKYQIIEKKWHIVIGV